MRFLLFVASLVLLATALYLTPLFGFAPYAQVARLAQVGYIEYMPDAPIQMPLEVTPGSYAEFRTGLWVLLGSSLLATLLQARLTFIQRQWRRLGRDIRLLRSSLVATLNGLTSRERLVATTLLLAILGARVFWMVTDSLSPDEVVSYDSFVHEGPLAIASFYPIPNNHIFYNLLSWLISQLTPSHVNAVVRLPSLLIATVGMAGSYALLAHWRSFRFATAVTALFSFTRITILYAAAGRGYYVQFVCLQLAFFAVVVLASGGAGRRLAWVVFIGSSVLGLYTIPTFALPLAALAVVLMTAIMGFTPRFRWPAMAHFCVAMAAIAVVTALLYWPVGLVSGWPRLLGNRYIASHSLHTFFTFLPAYSYETTDMLFGQVRPTLIIAGALLAITPFVLLRVRFSPRMRWLAWFSWALVVAPVVLMLAQQVLIPARVLLYTTFFLYVLGALGAEYALVRWPTRWAAQVPFTAAFALVGFRLWQLGGQVPNLLASPERSAPVINAYKWLKSQPPGEVFIGASYHNLMFHHYAILDQRPLAVSTTYNPKVSYQYIVWATSQPQAQPNWAVGLPYRAVYRDVMAIVYALQPAPRVPGHHGQ